MTKGYIVDQQSSTTSEASNDAPYQVVIDVNGTITKYKTTNHGQCAVLITKKLHEMSEEDPYWDIIGGSDISNPILELKLTRSDGATATITGGPFVDDGVEYSIHEPVSYDDVLNLLVSKAMNPELCSKIINTARQDFKNIPEHSSAEVFPGVTVAELNATKGALTDPEFAHAFVMTGLNAILYQYCIDQNMSPYQDGRPIGVIVQPTLDALLDYLVPIVIQDTLNELEAEGATADTVAIDHLRIKFTVAMLEQYGDDLVEDLESILGITPPTTP